MTPDFPLDEYQIDPQLLKAALDAAFDDDALRDLCFALGVSYEDDLDAGNTGVKKRSLVQVMQQRRQLAVLAQEIVRRRSQFTAGSFSRDTRADDSPFRGLEYYREADAHLFFGRDALTQTLLTHLIPEQGTGQRFLAVVGASGSGKSSVVRAGLVPVLRRETDWPIHIITPTARPLEALAATLTQDSESVTATTTLIDDLATDPRSLHLYVRRLLGDFENRPTRLLLVIDQFEELFTLCKDEAARQAFVDNIVHAAADASAGPTVVVLTLRADFYHRCLQYEPLHALLEQQQKIVPAMSAAELRAAIEQPAANAGLHFEDGLVDLLLRDVGATDGTAPEPGALPLLSHALLETWRRRDGNRLTLAGYQAAGGVQGAIAQTAESVYQSLDAEQQQIARNIFLRLTELGEGTQDTRRRAAVSELLPQGDARPQVNAVLRRLADARLLTTDRSDAGQTSAGYAEVAHEALIREWPTLRDWLDADRASLRLHSQLTEATRNWIDNDHDDSFLYRGGRLAQAQEWRADSTTQLNEVEQAFLTASQQHEQKQAQQRRLLRVGLFAVLIVIIGSLLVAVRVVQNQATETERQRKIALAQSVAALSGTVLEQQSDETELATLLAIEGARLNWDAVGNLDWLIYDTLRSFLDTKIYFNSSLRGHEDWVWSVAFSPDGQTLASGSSDQTIRLWDLSQPGAEPTVLRGHEASVWSVAFSPDGETLASGSGGLSSDDNTIRLWDLSQPGAEPTVLRGHEASVLSVAFSPDGETLASGSDDQTIRLWDLSQPGAEPTVLRGHEAWVRSVAFSPDGETLASGSDDQTIRLWDISAVLNVDLSQPGAEPTVLRGHEARVRSVAFSPDGQTLASGSDDQTIRLWDISAALNADLSQWGAELTVLRGHEASVLSVAFSPDGQTLASGSGGLPSDYNTIRLWDLSQPRAEPTVLRGHEAIVWSVAFSPDGETLASGSSDQTIRVWDLSQPGAEPTVLRGHEARVRSVAFSPDGETLASGSSDQTIRLWDLSQPGAEPTVLRGHEATVLSVAFSPDGETLASGSSDQTIRLWDISAALNADLSQSEAEPTVLRGHEASVWSVAFAPDGQTLASGSGGLISDDNTIRLWDLSQPGTEPTVLRGHEASVWSVAFAPDGQALASGSSDQTIRLWDLSQPGTGLTVLRGHEASVWSVAFAPDGQTLASGSGGLISDDNTIRLWDLSQPGTEPTVLRGHEASVWSVAFAPDGQALASGSSDQTIRLWDLSQPGTGLTVLRGHEASVLSVAFAPDGQTLASGSSDQTIRLWVFLEELVEIGCQKVRRNLTQAEWARYLPGEAYRQTCPNLPPGE